MRVLFTCVVGHGHFHPMVPLAQALRVAGHDVVVATDPGFCAYVEHMGFEAHPAGLDHAEARAQFMATTPEWAPLSPDARMASMQPGMFGRVRVPPMLIDLHRIIEHVRPSLLIHDSLEMAGAIAAEAAGIAHAEHSVGIVRPLGARRASTEVVAPFSTALGVRNPGVGGLGGELYIDICPPAIQSPEIADVSNRQLLRPVGFDGGPGQVLPDWVTDRSGRPLVYLTLGTVFNEAIDVFRTVLAGLGPEPVDILVTVGEKGDPASLGEQPSNVHVTTYLPQSRILPFCALMVSHAGSGSMLGAMAAGVPMLAVPQGADQFLNADRIVAASAGTRLLPGDLSPEAVRTEVRRLLGEPRFAEAARAQQHAIEAMPAPEAVVPLLEALARDRFDGG